MTAAARSRIATSRTRPVAWWRSVDVVGGASAVIAGPATDDRPIAENCEREKPRFAGRGESFNGPACGARPRRGRANTRPASGAVKRGHAAFATADTTFFAASVRSV